MGYQIFLYLGSLVYTQTSSDRYLHLYVGLRELEITRSALTTAPFGELNAPNLRVIDFSDNTITKIDGLPIDESRFSSAATLDLSNTLLDDATKDALKNQFGSRFLCNQVSRDGFRWAFERNA